MASTFLMPGNVDFPVYRVTLTGAERLTMEATIRLVLIAYDVAAPLILGSPKAPASSFTVPTDYFLGQLFRLQLINNTRATLQGTADLVLSDDFATRGRIVLAGRG